MTRLSICIRGALAVAVVLLVPAGLFAQSQAAGGTIEGTITDASGAVLPAAAVLLKNEATGVVRETRTDGTGVYKAPLLPVGSYEVTASLAGFATTRRPGQRLTVGAVLIADLSLKVATAQEEVTVSDEAPLIETSRTAQSSSVNERSVANLPVNGRNFIDFTLTTPGVVKDTRTGDISFAGQRGTLNSLIIDGADNNNTFFGQTLGRTGSGRAPYQFSQDAVQEFEVNRNAYSAEYGRAGGAVINVVTKSGTNAFHGSAFEFFRDDSLDANSYANKIRKSATSPAAPRQPLRIQQFGGSLGGPIVKDKAFFFLSYDAQRRSIPNPITLTLPTLPTDADTQKGLALVQEKAGDYNLTRDQDVFLAKVDWQLNSKHRLTFRYNHQNFTGANNESSGATSALEHTGDSLVHTRTANASLSSVFSPTFFNELRAQYAKDSEPGEANTNDPEVTVRQGGQLILVFGRNFFSPRETTITRWQVADVATLIRGRHTWKAGFDLNFDDILNYFPGNFGGRYTFNSLADLGRGVPNATGESYAQGFAGAGTTGPTTEPNLKEYAVFAQDEWRAKSNLVVTLGVRYDYQDIAQPAVRNPSPELAAAGIDTSVIPVDGNNLAPRLGFAWTPSKSLVVRGGYGIFYGRTPSIMYGTAHSGNAVNVTNVTFTGTAVPVYPAVFTDIPTGALPPKPSIQFFDQDFQNPLVHQASVGADYALTRTIAVAASYLFVAGRDLPRSNDFNVGDPVVSALPIQGGGTLSVRRYPTRPFSSFDRMVRFESTAESKYNGFTLELRKRFAQHWQANLAYTLGKVEDSVPDATNVVLGGGDDARFQSDPRDFDLDRAPGNNDVRHRLVFSGYWDLSYFRESGGLAKAVLNDWSVSWIAFLQTGQPYSQLVTNDLNLDGNRSNDIVPGSRDVERLPTQYNVDLRLQRRLSLGKQVKLDLIAEAFNLLNSTIISNRQRTYYNFASGLLVPQQNLSNPRLNFGADSAALDARAIQLAAKVTF